MSKSEREERGYYVFCVGRPDVGMWVRAGDARAAFFAAGRELLNSKIDKKRVRYSQSRDQARYHHLEDTFVSVSFTSLVQTFLLHPKLV